MAVSHGKLHTGVGTRTQLSVSTIAHASRMGNSGVHGFFSRPSGFTYVARRCCRESMVNAKASSAPDSPKREPYTDDHINARSAHASCARMRSRHRPPGGTPSHDSGMALRDVRDVGNVGLLESNGEGVVRKDVVKRLAHGILDDDGDASELRGETRRAGPHPEPVGARQKVDAARFSK